AWELTVRALWRDRRELSWIAASCAIVAAATLPFLLPYVELRRLGFSPRSLDETRRFSADVYAYFTADPNLRLWGPILQVWPHAEGLLFPGFAIVALAVIGSVSTRAPSALARERRPKRVAGGLALTLFAGVVLALLLGYSIRLPGLKITSFSRTIAVGSAGGALLLIVSRSARAACAAWLRSPSAWLVLSTLFAVAMSFGPDVHAKGRTIAGVNIYTLFYDFVPGFDGLRVPARFAMIGTLALAGLAGFGVAALESRYGRRAALASGALIVLEAIAIPI